MKCIFKIFKLKKKVFKNSISYFQTFFFVRIKIKETFTALLFFFVSPKKIYYYPLPPPHYSPSKLGLARTTPEKERSKDKEGKKKNRNNKKKVPLYVL